jgi:hypothetical protein
MKIMDLLEVEVESAPQPQDFSQSSSVLQRPTWRYILGMCSQCLFDDIQEASTQY